MATATLPGIVEMFVRPGQGVAEAAEIQETPVPQVEAETVASDLSISPVAELKTNQAFLDAGYPERIQMLHQAIAQERKMPRVKRRFADLAPEKQREFTTGLLALGLTEPSAPTEVTPSAEKGVALAPPAQVEAPTEVQTSSGTETAPSQVSSTPIVPAPLVVEPSAQTTQVVSTGVQGSTQSVAIQQPPSSALPTELPVVATEVPTAATPPATRIDQLTQMRDALQVQQQPQPQVVTPAIGENAITPAPSPPITDETIRGLVDQVSGYPGIDAYKAKLEKNPTLVDAYDRQVAKLPQMAQRVLNYGPVREKLLIGDSVDTGALKAITEIFGLPATVFNAMSKLNTAWYKSKGIGAEVATPEIPFEGADLRRMGSAILGVRPGELDAPKGHLQVIQRIAEELTGTV